MSDDTSNESEKILESLFDPENAEILVELKDGPKSLSILIEKTAISKEGLDEKLSYLIEKGFVSKNEKNGNISMDTETLKNKFMEEYQKTFGSKLDTVIEIVATRASLRVQLPRKSESGKIDEEDIAVSNNHIECYSFAEDKKLQFDLVARSKIDSKISGPLIIIESTAITYVDVNYDVDKDSSGNLLLTDKEIN